MGLFDPVSAAVRLALPPRCPGCGTPVAADHRFCVGCWGGLHFLGPPWCAGCNIPFAFDRGEGALCGACLASPPRHAGVRAAVAYGPVARHLALRLKYGRRIAFAETMARLMVRHLPEGADLIVPVPLHRWRIWSRGYNQAALIAAHLSTLSSMAWDRDALIRTRHTAPLKGVSGQQRAKAVAGAFHVAADGPARSGVRGRTIVLVDDVHTSGATADACTRALLAAGARSVMILCWARVLPDADD